jgi:hypothetical protein
MIDKSLPKKPGGKAVVKSNRSNLPGMANVGGQLSKLFAGVNNKSGKLPNASIVYGLGASGLFVISIFTFFGERWFTGFILLVLAGVLTGFALHFIKHNQ